MIRSILVPLDGSRFGEHALPWALTIARRAQARLQLAHVHVPLLYIDTTMGYETKVDDHVLQEEEAYLQKTVQRLARISTVLVEPVLLNGPVVETLAEHTQASGVDLIVMTTHGRGPLSRVWLGSVADELIRRTTKPLLLVRPEERAPDLTKERLLRHMLIPLDGSPLAEDILEPALALGVSMGTNYKLLWVVKPLMPLSPDISMSPAAESAQIIQKRMEELHGEVTAEARRYLDRVAERLRARACQVETRVATGAQPAAAILEEAAATGSDVIALETHGRQGMARLLLGSVADKVVRGASTPVLISRHPGK
jgi:nucleotide-binding universal stress UspA family protein